MNTVVYGGRLSGETKAIASKSVVHRLLICSAFCKSPTVIRGFGVSRDTLATAGCLRAFAADTEICDGVAKVMPYREITRNPLLNCDECGAALRFLLPVIAALGTGATFTGCGRLAERPLSPLYGLLCENGCALSPEGRFPLAVAGKLHGSDFSISGGVSSQFISGLLLAAPLLERGCAVRVTGRFESRSYVDITCDIMRKFGVETVCEKNEYIVAEGSFYRSPGSVFAEGDWSNAAFWLVAAVLSNSRGFKVSNLNLSSLQGDREIMSILRRFGAELKESGDTVEFVRSESTRPMRIDASDIPDLVPVLAVLACGAVGETEIYNAGRLALKESNRLTAVRDMLLSLGGRIEVTSDTVTVAGTGRLRGGTVDSRNDHRIAMAAAVASFICDSPVTVTGSEAVKKSYPAFFAEFEARGMRVCRRCTGAG